MRRIALVLLLAATAVHAEVTVERGSVVVAGVGKVHTVLSKPAGASGKLPAILVAGWLSCDSVDSQDLTDGFIRFLRDVGEQSGFIVMRVDKPGVGGSDGKCAQTDFQTELAGYRAGWVQLAARPDVDPTRMYVLGMSNGAGIAPLVPSEPRAAGFLAIGGWSKTWYEHMLAIERRRLTLKRLAPGEVTTRMRAIQQFYDDYLNRGRTPKQILAERTDLAAAWEGSPDTQYGRPPAFFQQLQQLNLAEAWSRVNAPTLVIFGAQDWLMDADDHRLIASSVNRNGANLATYAELPRMDHFFMRHASMQDGFDGKPGEFETESVTRVLRWLRGR